MSVLGSESESDAFSVAFAVGTGQEEIPGELGMLRPKEASAEPGLARAWGPFRPVSVSESGAEDEFEYLCCAVTLCCAQ